MKDILTYRYEFKYVLNPESFDSLIYCLNLHPAGFRETFPDRWINNIYFDDCNISCCRENLAGISERQKIRYRWYGELENFSKGRIEKKIKSNQLGTKEYIELESPQSVMLITQQLNNHFPFREWLPIVQNRYLRSYFIDRDQKFRLTLDRKIRYNLVFDNYMDIKNSYFREPKAIVEIKFDMKNFHSFDKISDGFPFRLNKYSKYVTGIFDLMY